MRRGWAGLATLVLLGSGAACGSDGADEATGGSDRGYEEAIRGYYASTDCSYVYVRPGETRRGLEGNAECTPSEPNPNAAVITPRDDFDAQDAPDCFGAAPDAERGVYVSFTADSAVGSGEPTQVDGLLCVVRVEGRWLVVRNI